MFEKGLSRRTFLKAVGATTVVATTLGSRATPARAQTQTPKGGDKKRITDVQRRAAAKRFRKEQATAAAATMVAAAPAAIEPLSKTPHYFGPKPNYAASPLPRGGVATIVMDDPGSGYTVAPAVMITDLYSTVQDVGGTGAIGTAVLNGTGGIASITVTAPGTHYTAPVVTIAAPDQPGGSVALASAVIGPPYEANTGIRKFVNGLPGLGAANANDLGQYIPVAAPDTITFPGSDYYEIELRDYDEKLHTDLPATRLRGYRQTNMGGTPSHYLGPMIIAKKGTPVRIKFTNSLPANEGGNLFLPVDETVMGAGKGPLMMAAMPMNYRQNRGTLHLHGGLVPWISDGTPHQWTTPAGDSTPYPKGVSVRNVPDMPDPGPGSMTFFYNNEQSARLMFYHDHSYGITRLNVYAGEAAPYLLTDDVEQDLITRGVLPGVGTPLVLQDKSFVDASTIAYQDPSWNWGITPGTPHTGDLWMPHVYMPAQNPWSLDGYNAFGRWMYSPWFWPPAAGIEFPPIPNPYADPANPEYADFEPPVIPATKNPSMGMEAFMDTPLVNGTAYPVLTVDPTLVRFRVLNAADDRFFNLSLYVADPAAPTEVKMVPAVNTLGFPALWPTDNREGGVPDPATAGPAWIQIGTEGGFLPEPVVIPAQPTVWNGDPTQFNVGNVTDHSLLLGCAERADVLVDFTPFAGKTLILFNDAPAAFPARIAGYDYYTNGPDNTGSGGTPPTQPGYGPNTRTVMQIKVNGSGGTAPVNHYDAAKLAQLKGEWAHHLDAAGKPAGVFEKSQDPVIFLQAAYNSAYGTNFPAPTNPAGVAANFIAQTESRRTFKPYDAKTGAEGAAVTIDFEPKAIQDETSEAYDIVYGRMSGMLGLENPSTVAGAQNFMLYPYPSPQVDIVADNTAIDGIQGNFPKLGDDTQIWMITHNGVDTHPIHVHLFNAQLINRVAWDGKMLPPEPNELGWKETIRVNPLEHTIFAVRAVAPPNTPFEVPNSVRYFDPTMPAGHILSGAPGGYMDPEGNPVQIPNAIANFGHEYVWHCHILSHEEMDMMHSLCMAAPPKAPSGLNVVKQGNSALLNWTNNATVLSATGILIQRADDNLFTKGLQQFRLGPTGTPTALPQTYTDGSVQNNRTYFYRVFAENTVGSGLPAFPSKTATSAPSNTFGYGAGAAVPANPTALTLTQATNPLRVNVTWQDNATNETGFVVERAVVTGTTVGAYAQIATPGARNNTGSVSYTDSTVVAGTTYSYQVWAVNGAGRSLLPAGPSQIIIGATATAPNAPTNLAAAIVTNPLRVRLTWTDNATNEGGFVVERTEVVTNPQPTDWTQVGTPGPRSNTGSVTYDDATVALAKAYLYRVKAVNGGASSAYATLATAVPTPSVLAAPTNFTATAAQAAQGNTNNWNVNLSWNYTNGAQNGFTIQRSTDVAFAQNLKEDTVSATSRTLSQTKLQIASSFYYRIRANAANGNTSVWVNCNPFPVKTQ
ncbi:MAG: multicopper oxidase domain-containing protein [Chloroflexota bacterium]